MARRVMVVEDDKELNEVLQYILAQAGYEALPVLDGEEAVAQLMHNTRTWCSLT